MTPGQRLEASRPIVAGGPKKPTRSPYFDETEKRLGELLQDELAAHLAANPAGKELFDSLRGPEGKHPCNLIFWRQSPRPRRRPGLMAKFQERDRGLETRARNPL